MSEISEIKAEENEEKAEWYILHTYSGYENKVKETIEQIVKNKNLGKYIQRVEVPEEEVIENKKKVKRKLYPCYVMLKMIMNGETWYICRNVAGSTGFVSQDSRLNPGMEAVPLTPEEVKKLGLEYKFRSGDKVKIAMTEYEGFTGTISSINYNEDKAKVIVEMFNKEQEIEVECSLIEKAEDDLLDAE